MDPAVEPSADRAERLTARLDNVGRVTHEFTHDINNQLGIVLNIGWLLERRLTDPAACAELDHIRRAAQQAVALTRQLGTLVPRDLAGSPHTDVNSLLRRLRPTLEDVLDPAVELRLEMAGAAAAAVDEQRLEIIVTQLVSNAGAAMSEGGTVTISVEPGSTPSQPVTLSVSDTGCGMSPELAQRAFEPFFTTRPDDAAADAGAGLGLVTVLGIVQMHDGHIRLDTTEGGGATIAVTLPASDGPVADDQLAR